MSQDISILRPILFIIALIIGLSFRCWIRTKNSLSKDAVEWDVKAQSQDEQVGYYVKKLGQGFMESREISKDSEFSVSLNGERS